MKRTLLALGLLLIGVARPAVPSKSHKPAPAPHQSPLLAAAQARNRDLTAEVAQLTAIAASLQSSLNAMTAERDSLKVAATAQLDATKADLEKTKAELERVKATPPSVDDCAQRMMNHADSFSTNGSRGLKGIHSVALSIVEGHQNESDVGSDTLTLDAQLILRSAGLRVLDSAKESVDGLVTLTVVILKGGDRGFAYRTDVDFSRRAFVPDIGGRSLLPVWQIPGVLGTTPPEETYRIRDAAKDMISAFANAYLEANPKP